MKEIHLRDLLGMADPSAHDGIGDLWNQKAIHFLVVFTCPDGDFELIGVGPTLPYPTLEEAEKHTIADKVPEFYLKCPAAVAGRLQPKLAPSPRAVTNPPAPMVNPAATPTMKARTSSPFARPTINLRPKPTAEGAEQGAGSGESKAGSGEQGAGSVGPKPETPGVQLETQNSKLETKLSESSLLAREQAIAQRERELAALSAALKIREASLRERETAMAAIEERLLLPARKPPLT